MSSSAQLAFYIKAHPDAIGKVVDFDPVTDRLYQLDLTTGNKDLNRDTITNPEKFNQWVSKQIANSHSKYGVGGYMEHRTIYVGIPLFESETGPRLLHLGVDIWGDAGTPIYAPLAGKVHSFADNNNFGDYGPTIILEHDLDGLVLYSLYGHLSRKSLHLLSVGMPVNCNQQIATLGAIDENGCWPPHLHFQLMFDMEGKQGDYPGACRFAEKEEYLKNIPDPQLILQFLAAVNG